MFNSFAQKTEISLETATALLSPDLEANRSLLFPQWKLCSGGFHVQPAPRFKSLEQCEVI